MKKNKEFFVHVTFKKDAVIPNIQIAFEGKTTEEEINFYYKTLKINTFDIVQYNDELEFIVDDEGLLKSGNPVFEIPNDIYVEPLNIAGGFLIGKRVVTEDDIKTIGFSSKDEADIALRKAGLKLKVIGVTR